MLIISLGLLFGVTLGSRTSGCGKALPSNITTTKTNKVTFETSSGTERTYLLHLPKTYNAGTAHPLVFSFHGRGSTGAGQEQLTNFSNPVLNANAIVAYPDGIDKMWQGDPDAHSDDVSFTLELTKALSNDYCLDDQKLFSTGFSNGAGFTLNILACDSKASRVFAAFAGASSADYQELPSIGKCVGETVPIKCNPGKQGIPILENHGTSDGVIAYNGGDRRGKCLPSIPHFMTEWSRRNGYGSGNVSTANFSGIHGLTRFQYGGGANVHYRKDGLGHTWPSVNGEGGYDLSKIIFDFFKITTAA